MNLINQSVEYLGPAPVSESDALAFIERAGRTCYKSEGKITEDSRYKFYKMLVSRTHTAMIEHSNICIAFGPEFDLNLLHARPFKHIYGDARTFFREFHKDGVYYLASNVRGWLEALRYSNKSYICPFLKQNYPTMFESIEDWGRDTDVKEKVLANMSIVDLETQKELNLQGADLSMFCFVVTTDRGVTHEAVRNRSQSFAQESTRWVNYASEAGLQAGISFIDPTTFFEASEETKSMVEEHFERCEKVYNELMKSGWKTNFARCVLPNGLKADIVISGRLSGWSNFFKLRCNPKAHPQMVEVAVKMREHLVLDEGYNFTEDGE